MEAPTKLERHVAGALIKTAFLRNRRGGPWTPELAHTRIPFEGNTGAKLVGHWFAAERPRGAVVLAHPDKRYGKHWFVKEGYVQLLLANGYDALTFDFVGYGESHGPATYYHEDVLAAARVAEHWAGGYPVHVLGVSMGAFAVANASPRLDFVRSLVLESPYPSFNAWYAGGAGKWAMEAFDVLFPRSSRAIQADRNIARAAPKHILVAYSPRDDVTPPRLSRAVADAQPRAEAIEVDAPHLGFLQSDAYRKALLATLAR